MGASSVSATENSRLLGIVQCANGLQRVLWSEVQRIANRSEEDRDRIYEYLARQGILTKEIGPRSFFIYDKLEANLIPHQYFFTSEFYATEYRRELNQNPNLHIGRFVQ
ncbi:hypothetical protein COU57_05180 [Candidatus Pacearchaeota archaeon CG10_big_fil_rev_8_21_14_0_10_32_14]|nr:MAG: hypothetical protein COU57_05180 [Candidatus Pacearchaeota archaeon CG10_big_fil_rev_8_21_14_0_10_32_14]